MSSAKRMNPASYKKNLMQKRPGQKQQVDLIIQEFGNIRVMQYVDMKLIGFLYSSHKTHTKEARIYVDRIVKNSFCKCSTGRIYLTIKLIKELAFTDLLEIALEKIKTFVRREICAHSKKVKKIFEILKKVEINVFALIKEIEDKFKFPTDIALAYRMAKIQTAV